MKDVNVILKSPVLSEKASAMKPKKKFVFEVAKNANKIEIKKAVETLYKVKVAKVNTGNMPSKWKRVRLHYGLTSEWKKAVVTLKEGDIDFYKV
jgi:large subunit ribosomal protein L23